MTPRTAIARLALAGFSGALAAAHPAAAAQQPAPTFAAAPVQPASAISFTTASAVAAYYHARPTSRLWFSPSTGDAGAELVGILRRAQLDGLAEAGRIAAEAEAALAAGMAGDAAAKSLAERTLSAAWVQYVQALKKPVPGVEYGDRSMAPRTPTAEWVLMQAEHAPSLGQHLRSMAAVNPTYASLRDAAWAQMQSTGQPADPRVLANLERARLLPAKGRYILVDAASARLWLFEDGKPPESMKVIVGKSDTQTPMIASTIHYATFNPYWNIPTDVTRKTVAPLVLKRGTKYLKAARYEVASDWTDDATVVPPDEIDWKAVAAGEKQIRIRQLPGKTNMMGALKFNFANSTGIYLHDTPQKALFDKDKRTFSLGCVRVEDAQKLARWLLQAEPTPPNSEPEQHVKLPQGVPIYITYLTAHADGGELSFADDVYGLDRGSGAEMAAAR